MESLQNNKQQTEPIVVHHHPEFTDPLNRERVLEDILHRMIAIYQNAVIAEQPEK